MKKTVFTLAALLSLAACSDGPNAERVLADSGYTNITTNGYAFFSCDDKSDSFATSFTATAPSGRTVTGAVCKGWFKGSTIRLD